ncbi:hypothetical protein OG413_43540 [Streptomyces sp. NBC_01433]|uniref:hypothetical protein n=1 Tax=Streptomyces sp. NBC_01433 TaxID=2903864 RepID=UPI002258F997|nr:hypothetical protein [Streptomyces sp. NBC_01433]MCX4682058.1 hypothetical protein [Streptomyces sp. NBC_01433]
MGIHFTTAVVPAERSGADTDNAVLIFAADTQDDIATLPLPVALHVQDNELGCFAPHGQMLGAPLRVSDAWVAAASPTGSYDSQARVCVVLEPLPEEAGTCHVPVREGVTEQGLASWVGDVVAGRYKMALRSVRVSIGNPLQLDAALGAPTQLPEWAEITHIP